MKSDDTAIPNRLEIKTVSPSSSSKDLVINTTSESQSSSSTDSSDSSPSDLRRRLEDLPSPNEFAFPADRVAARGRRACRKREAFLRLHGAANRIEENDEWEEREQRAGLESFLEVSRPKDARARRRARARLKSPSRRDDDGTMVMSQAGGSAGGSAAGTVGVVHGKLNPTESSAGRSARDNRPLLSAIAIPRGQSRPSSEPSTTRLSHRSNGESRDARCKTVSHTCRDFTPRDLPSVSPFSLSGAQPRKFGGYRPPSGVILKNLSSGSESESANETSHGLPRTGTIAMLELSSPASTAVNSSANGPVKKMPIMSARDDIAGSILPNLLPSSRSLDNDGLNRRMARSASRSYTGPVNRDCTKTCDEPGGANTPVKAIFNERASQDWFAAQTCGELRQDEPEYEDTRHQRQEIPRATSTFLAASFTSAELATSTCDEQVIHNELATEAYDEFKLVGSEFEGEGEQVRDYQCIGSQMHHDVQARFEFNCPSGRSNFEADPLGNNGVVPDDAQWHRSASLYARDAVDTSRFIETIRSDVAEGALSSSEPYGSEDHSRSSCAANMYPWKEAPDKCDRESITKVPTLALNSQDISYSTSAGSRECSATRALDPHALIRALSDVSLKQEKRGEDASRRCKDTGGASDFPTKGETWRVPTPSASLSRVPSRIPVRISDGRIAPPGDKLSSCYGSENSGETANYAEAEFVERNDVPRAVRQRRPAADSLHLQDCEDSSPRPRSQGVGGANVEDALALDDETELDDRAPGGFISSNLWSSRSTPFGDNSYGGTWCPPGSGFQGEGCPPVVFSRGAAYSAGRDYARIGDDVRSRSGRSSTSRKSADTADVTSATASPGLSRRYGKTESLRNVEENVTWRTEDECASIRDEENPEDAPPAKDCTACDETPEEPATGGTWCDDPRARQLDSPAETRQGGRKRRAGDDLEFNDGKTSPELSPEMTRVAQSEDLTFQVRRTRELPSFAARLSSSTLNLNCEPRGKRTRKSQERFPFTIAEASAALSAKREDRRSPGEEANDQLRGKRVRQLRAHPSVTRLAASGTEDTVADILCCVAQEKKVASATSSKSKIRALVRSLFSSKLRRASSGRPRPAEIIYENDACRAGSRGTNSCSGDSSTEGPRRTCSSDRWLEPRAAGSKPALVPSWETLRRTESLRAIARERLHRRYDRDDLWVQDVKDSPADGETPRGKDGASGSREAPPAKDPYSIFLAKKLQPDEPSTSSSPEERRDVPISDHVTTHGNGERSIDRQAPPNLISEAEETEEELTDCLCWRLCRVIAPFAHRSPVRERAPATRTRGFFGSLLRKREK